TSTTARPFEAGIDEVAVYPAALAGARLLAHYHAGYPVVTDLAAQSPSVHLTLDAAPGQPLASTAGTPFASTGFGGTTTQSVTGAPERFGDRALYLNNAGVFET